MKNSLLLVIDFINDIVNPESETARNAAFAKANHTLENANRAIAWARENNVALAHVKVGFSDDYLECPKQSPLFSKAAEYKKFRLSDWGTEFHPSMDVRKEDKIIIKHRVSAFYNTDLETVLRANHIDHLIICGVATHMAVELTAREAHDRDYRVTVLANACAAPNETLQLNSLAVLEQIAEVTEVSELY